MRESSVIQAFVLLILYGIYRDSGSKFQKARSLFRTIIDVRPSPLPPPSPHPHPTNQPQSLRDLELFHQTLTAPSDPTWSTDLSPSLDTSAPSLLHSKWTAYITSESLKLSLYALLYLDTQAFASACNMRPLLSPIELGWELPHAASLWEANDASAWLAALYACTPSSSGAAVSLSPSGSAKYAFSSPTTATRTLTLATQSLLSGTPCPHLVAALAASPFAALCVAANVEGLVRDFTRCYYVMPPSLSDPSLFHILTQAQNKHVVAALRAVGEARARARGAAGDGGGGGGAGGGIGGGSQIWRAVDLVLASARAGLCAPDDLLIGGIVDNGVAAGLATSAHLTLGSYFASRRSTMQQQQQQQDASGGAVASSSSSEVNVAGSLSLLAELMPALEQVVVGQSGGADEVCDEGPWVTVVMIRLLITIWKTVRHVVEHVRQRSSDGSMAFDPAGVTLRAVTEAVERYIRLLVPDYEPDTDQDSQEKDWGYHERSLLLLTVELCKRRSAWPVGPALATVFEEIMAAII